MTVSKSDPQFQSKVLKRLERFSYWTDSNFRVPFTQFRFGLSPLIGLVPVVGDAIGLVLSLYVLQQARLVAAPRRLQLRMVANMLIEFFGGLLPVIGDAFDAIYKANTRNTELLRGWLHEQLDQLPKKRFPWWTLVWLSVLLALLLGLIILMVL